MCNLSDIVEDRGIEIGKAQGIELGKEQGIEIGKEQGRLATVYKLVQSGEFTLEHIAKLLDIPVEELRADMEAENFHVK